MLVLFLLRGERAGYKKQIVVPPAQQLSWSHFIALLPIKSDEASMFYAKDAVARHLSKRELRLQISRKAYERREIVNAQLTEVTTISMYMTSYKELKTNQVRFADIRLSRMY